MKKKKKKCSVASFVSGIGKEIILSLGLYEFMHMMA